MVAVAVSPAEPSAQVVHQTTTELWQAGKLKELEQYLTEVGLSRPNSMLSIAARASVNYYFKADIDGTRREVNRIITAYPTARGLPYEFGSGVAAQFEMCRIKERNLRAKGETKEQYKQSADPQRWRDFLGNKLPDIMEALRHAPLTEVP